MQPDKGGTATVRRAYREDIDWLRAAFRIAGLTTAGLLAGSTAGIVTSQAPSDADRAALQLESYNAFICFGGRCDLSGAAMPLTIDGGIPLAWDHAHLTAEGSVYVMGRLMPTLELRSKL
jgi:hypothetical protein